MNNFSKRLITAAILLSLSGLPQLANAASVKLTEGTPVSIRFDEK
jgi:hypothetical protein